MQGPGDPVMSDKKDDQLNKIKRETKIREKSAKRNDKVSKKCGTMWRDLIYAWSVYLNVMGRINPSWKTLQHIIQENFPSLARQSKFQIQEIQRTPQRYSSRRTTPRHIIIRFTRVEIKEKMLRQPERQVRSPAEGSQSDSQWISQQKPYKPEESGGEYSTSLKKTTFNPEYHIQPNQA